MTEKHSADGAHIAALLEAVMRASEPSTPLLMVDQSLPSASPDLPPDVRLRLWTLRMGALMEETADFPEGRPVPTYHREQLRVPLAAAGLAERPDAEVVRRVLAAGHGRHVRSAVAESRAAAVGVLVGGRAGGYVAFASAWILLGSLRVVEASRGGGSST